MKRDGAKEDRPRWRGWGNEVGIVLALPAILLLIGVCHLIIRLRRGVIIRGMRRTGRGIETSVRTLRSSAGQAVSLVGTMHIGEKRYFAAIQEYLDSKEAEGYRILFEGVKGSGDGEGRKQSVPAVAVEERLDNMILASKLFQAHAGLVHQKEGLRVGERWVNTDVTDTEVSECLVEEGAANVGLSDEEVGSLSSDRARLFTPYMLDKMAREPLAVGVISWFLNGGPLGVSRMDRVLIGKRNDVAVAGIRQALGETDKVVSVWGCAHLSGIERLLKEDGFILEDEQWFTSYTFRNLTWADTVAKIKAAQA